MIRTLYATNFTVFPKIDLSFGHNLNVIVGENGAGKTHLLKLAYSVLAASWEEGRKPNAQAPTKAVFQPRLADKLVGVFRPETLGRLTRRRQGTQRSELRFGFFKKEWDLGFSFSSHSKSEVTLTSVPKAWVDAAPAYLPTRELLSIYPGFVSVYEGHYLEFEETWRDTCVLLGAPLKRGPKEERVRELVEPLEKAMGGRLDLDKNGRFYLVNDSGRMEIPLVAEGLRKLGMLARLIATGAILDKGCLFWDEPEANLNARIIKDVARSILALSAEGIQVFIATHSLFLLRELEILLRSRTQDQPKVQARFFGLHSTKDGVKVEQGPTADEIGDIAVLTENLEQSDRFLEAEEAP